MPTTTPSRIDESVRSFCRYLNQSAEPVYVDVQPGPADKRVECFFNVRRYVEGPGGQFAYGWSIKIWEKVYIEAEHHAVWLRPDGTLLDVTPMRRDAARTLFLRDDRLTFDFEGMWRRDNVRHALIVDALVVKFLEAAACWAISQEERSNGKAVSCTERDTARVLSRYRNLQLALYRKYLRDNDTCPCDSGRKVKRCCGLEQWTQRL